MRGSRRWLFHSATGRDAAAARGRLQHQTRGLFVSGNGAERSLGLTRRPGGAGADLHEGWRRDRRREGGRAEGRGVGRGRGDEAGRRVARAEEHLAGGRSPRRHRGHRRRRTIHHGVRTPPHLCVAARRGVGIDLGREPCLYHDS